MSEYTVQLKKDDILFLQGEIADDLYILHRGKLMIFVVNGSQVTPLYYVRPGEFLGELAYFDHQPRSACVVALEESHLVRIPASKLNNHMPDWLVKLAASIGQKIRLGDQILSEKGIRRKNAQSLKPLSIEEQRYYFQLVQAYQKQMGITEV